MEQLRQLIVALVGREEVGCASGSGEGTVDNKVWKSDERGAGESSTQPGRRLGGGKVTERKETGRTETGGTETGGKTTGAKETGGRVTGVRETGGKETLAKAAKESEGACEGLDS